jgi:hypothetical protein
LNSIWKKGIGDYKIRKFIGRGGSAIVHKDLHKTSNTN